MESDKIEQILKRNVLSEIISRSKQNEEYANEMWIVAWNMNTSLKNGITKGAEEYANRRIVEVLEGILTPNMGETYARLKDKIKELKSDPNDLPNTVGGGYGE